ncbi:MAG TPA: hypothetical protein VGT05_04445 [Patescibacteria group bacterium]|nr:hypothetical protein [Patescibacteria group bacterium]
MKKILPLLVIISCLALFFCKDVLAYQTQETGKTQVSAIIGSFYINIYGYIARFASISLIYNDNVLASTVSDANGYFSFLNLVVGKGFNKLCFDAVDVKRLGESQSCFDIQPVMVSRDIRDLYLPPTIGVYRTQINAGSNAIIFGYSMSGARVTIHINNGKTYTVIADNTGYYEIHVLLAKAGIYQFFADAVYQSKKSQEPLNKATILVLGVQEQVRNSLNDLLKKLIGLLTTWWFIFLLLIIAIFILILILWKKFNEKTTGFPNPAKEDKQFFDRFFRNKKLHHAWFVGY